MEVPEKIYLQPLSKHEIYYHWYRNKLTNDFIEYTHTIAFIDKAIDWLSNHVNDYIINDKYTLPN